MIRVIRPGRRIETWGQAGEQMGFTLAPHGSLLIGRVEKVSRLGPQGLMEGIEQTPIKAYAPGQWLEVEYVEEPGDGLALPAPGAGVGSAP